MRELLLIYGRDVVIPDPNRYLIIIIQENTGLPLFPPSDPYYGELRFENRVPCKVANFTGKVSYCGNVDKLLEIKQDLHKVTIIRSVNSLDLSQFGWKIGELHICQSSSSGLVLSKEIKKSLHKLETYSSVDINLVTSLPKLRTLYAGTITAESHQHGQTFNLQHLCDFKSGVGSPIKLKLAPIKCQITEQLEFIEIDDYRLKEMTTN